MKRLVSILYMLLVMVLAIATFVECEKGSSWVATHIYHSFWFAALWGILALLAVVIIARKRLWHKTSMLMFHASFFCILLGALITFLFGVRGTIHLVEGSSEKRFISDNQHLVQPLPFTLHLDSFRIEHYAGTSAVADYISYLHVDDVKAEVSMNQILRYKGYRFCQASFDEDGKGSYLSVNHDPWGIAITYTGYLMLALSSIGLLLSPRGGFRKLLKHPLLRRGAACLLF
ncbi:MAG: cytochrome c biogenesis protein ResB, partial [Bacteroides sp.]|nr:cytochrome c biogenesis protein ResB [Bacteroides sp.]